MYGKKRKRYYKRNYKKNYKTPLATIKRAPKTEIKCYHYGIDKDLVDDQKYGFDLLAAIEHGTEVQQRIGNKITVVGLRVRLRYTYYSEDFDSVNAVVRHFLFWSRVDLPNVAAGGTWFINNDDKGMDLEIVDMPVNKQVAIPLRDKVFPVSKPLVPISKIDDDNWLSCRATEQEIGFVDYFLKLNRDVYYSGVTQPNPQLILADSVHCSRVSESKLNIQGLVTIYYLDN